MQISENLLRVIFMLSTIVAVTDCCSSRILLLKEHTLQIVHQHRLQTANGDDYDYDHDDYEQRQQQPLQQQQKLPQYVDIANSNLEFNKNYTDEHMRSRDNEESNVDTTALDGIRLAEFGSDSFESLLGIFDAAAFETSTTSKTNAQPAITQTTTEITTTTIVGDSSNTESSTEKQIKNYATTETSSMSTGTATTPTIVASVETVVSDLAAVRDRVVDILSIPCSGQFVTEFCLNRGRCFRYLIGNDTIHSCVCADGYIGERCESKSMNGSYVPSIAGANKKHKIVMARIVFSFPMLVALSVIYILIGAAIVFKRAPLTPKQQTELADNVDEGENILMHACTATATTSNYSAYTD